MNAKTCKARACAHVAAPKIDFCARHWGILPQAFKLAIWAEYEREGEEPTAEYLAAVAAATDELARIMEAMHTETHGGSVPE